MSKACRLLLSYMFVFASLLMNSLTSAQSDDYYCGTYYSEAKANCAVACPSGDDSECAIALGAGYLCYYFTGCAEKIANGFVPVVPSAGASEQVSMTEVPNISGVVTGIPTTKPTPLTADATEMPTPAPMHTVSEAKAEPLTSGPVVVIDATKPISSPPTPAPQVVEITNKPTRRTKIPTPAVSIQSSKPSKLTVTTTPTSSYIKSIKTASRKELNGNSGSSTSTSYGYIFSMRTTSDSPVMQVVGFAFLTASTNNLNFEVYSTPGSYAGIKGYYGRWVLIGSGIIQGKGIGQYTSIPTSLISPVPVDGLGSVRSFYVTLSTKDMIYRVTSTGDVADEAIQQASAELEMYEGESVFSFPFPLGEADGAYLGPSQFIGAVYYDTLPCKPLSTYGAVYSLPCPFIPTISPVPTSSTPTTLAPTISRAPPMSPSIDVTHAPSYVPTTMAPTVSSLPTGAPTVSPAAALESEICIVVTLRNTANRNMTTSEEELFEEKILAFFSLHSLGDANVRGVNIWYQQRVEWKEHIKGKRKLQELSSTAVALILQVSHYGSSSALEISDTIVRLIQEGETSIVNALRGNEEYPFFFKVDAMQSRVTEEATTSPVEPPGSAYPANLGNMDEAQLTEKTNVAIYAGVGSAVLAFVLIVISSSYYLSKRHYHVKEVSTRPYHVEDLETGPMQSTIPPNTAGADSVKESEKAVEKSGLKIKKSENDSSGKKLNDSYLSVSANSDALKETENKAEDRGNGMGDPLPGECLENFAAVIHDYDVKSKVSSSLSSSSSSSSKSSSDSGSSSDSELRAKLAERRMQRKASHTSAIQEKSKKKGSLHQSVRQSEIDASLLNEDLHIRCEYINELPSSSFLSVPHKKETHKRNLRSGRKKGNRTMMRPEHSKSLTSLSAGMKRSEYHRSRDLDFSSSDSKFELKKLSSATRDHKCVRYLKTCESNLKEDFNEPNMAISQDLTRNTGWANGRSRSLVIGNERRSFKHNCTHVPKISKTEKEDVLKEPRERQEDNEKFSKHDQSICRKKPQRRSSDCLTKPRTGDGSDHYTPLTRHTSSRDLRKSKRLSENELERSLVRGGSKTFRQSSRHRSVSDSRISKQTCAHESTTLRSSSKKHLKLSSRSDDANDLKSMKGRSASNLTKSMRHDCN